jgi:hypothetical protein
MYKNISKLLGSGQSGFSFFYAFVRTVLFFKGSLTRCNKKERKCSKAHQRFCTNPRSALCTFDAGSLPSIIKFRGNLLVFWCSATLVLKKRYLCLQTGVYTSVQKPYSPPCPKILVFLPLLQYTNTSTFMFSAPFALFWPLFAFIFLAF